MTVATVPREEGAIQVELTLPVRQRRREIRAQPSSTSRPGSRPWIPRITRLMALAIKFQDMINRGEVRDYADLARLGYVTRARVTQIMNLLMLAPDIQEHLLSSDEAILGVRERFLRGLCAQIPWTTQRHQWKALLARSKKKGCAQPELRLRIGSSPHDERDCSTLAIDLPERLDLIRADLKAAYWTC